jgi:hypothetical protein
MSMRPTIAERAFQLARTGEYLKVRDLKAALKREGYEQIDAHLGGASIAKPLRIICEEAHRLRQAETPVSQQNTA